MGKQWKQWETFIFFGSKITADGDCSHETKRCLLLGRKAMANLDSIKKQRHHFANKDTQSQNYGFSGSHVWIWELDNKEGWLLKNWCYGLWCWRRLLRVSWTARRSNQSILKEISPEYSLEGLILKLKLQYFGHQMWRANPLQKTLMLGKTEVRRRRGWQRTRCLDGITDSIEQAPGDGEGQGSLVCCSPQDHKELDMTDDWTTTTIYSRMAECYSSQIRMLYPSMY